GNLGDITLRALETLKAVDFIAAEDTRVTAKLLNRFEIKKPMLSYFEHNKAEKGEIICAKILKGESCALVTDAGMPCISDPGEELVKQAYSHGIAVEVVPGPTAFASALAVSGQFSGRFCFEGFLSMNKKSRTEHLNSLINESRTIIFYEAPHKLKSTLEDILTVLGDRNISLCRELTKIHEEVNKTTVQQALAALQTAPAKGEYVLVIEGAQKKPDENQYTLEQAVKIAQDEILGGAKKPDAAKTAAAITGCKKNDIYAQLL
ncbi:MAG: 16S rRNA (cytidine(1402)-2'-O)-methyltransferase, partial [Oscillospiraceae bacterium]|nr:16S rRNA (cytidine(1402)-2'-O)-methyltransferase [Oscillospiraceae bacterium]